MIDRRFIALVLLGAAGMSVGCSASADDSGSPEIVNAGDLVLSSAAFDDGSAMPVDYAMRLAGGRDVSPPLEWRGAPPGTRSFALECVDLAPIAGDWVHWLVADIPARAASLPLGASRSAMPAGAREFRNGFREVGWGGPQPPPGSGTHEYRFVLYAVDVPSLELPSTPALGQFRAAVREHALASATFTGTFRR